MTHQFRVALSYVATHEAAHAVVAVACEVPVLRAALTPFEPHTDGEVVSKFESLDTAAELVRFMAIAAAGVAVAELAGLPVHGCESDLSRVELLRGRLVRMFPHHPRVDAVACAKNVLREPARWRAVEYVAAALDQRGSLTRRDVMTGYIQAELDVEREAAAERAWMVEENARLRQQLAQRSAYAYSR